ncbi:putative GPI transamidase component GAA1 [Trypanosoma theileri]|uniref:Putative GPI transamidase component GAA1 n=1 Tax=Trypanosoma theileri TaxID=67003 RepID=A0A1X0NIY4_9TRYP|nr:putative GPI transamidase component GAA1 [Trypanosoma theileri]ORC84149.1 putative GPI transamidase component GAA1 [Trypanosoma theileri]
MRRSRLVGILEKRGGHIAPFLLLVGLILIGGIPAIKPRRNFIDESAVSIGEIPVLISLSDMSHPDTTVHQSHRIVHGRRSVGSEIIAIYVNKAEKASVILGNALIAVLRKRENMACDTHFYFVANTDKDWPIPNSFVRSALVINVSSLNTRNLCFGVYGKNGMQPNQDLFNVAVSMAKEWGLKVDVLCQNPYTTYSLSRSMYEHYITALQTALIAPQYPQPWHSFRSHGISSLSISTVKSDENYNRSDAFSMVAMLEQIIATLSYLDERFHHSTSVWVPLSVTHYIEYDIAQFGIMLLVASLLSTGYSIYKVKGLNLSPYVMIIWITPFIVSIATEWFETLGFFLSSILLLIILSTFDWDLSWLTINAVVLCLLIILQPAAGLIMGSGVALQLLFLHVKCQNVMLLALGSLCSWAIFFYFVHVLNLRGYDIHTTGGIYLSFFVYPNALWVSSRLIRSIVYYKG